MQHAALFKQKTQLISFDGSEFSKINKLWKRIDSFCVSGFCLKFINIYG